jgi:hypothetical protein
MVGSASAEAVDFATLVGFASSSHRGVPYRSWE